jgi:hypothetical protein
MLRIIPCSRKLAEKLLIISTMLLNKFCIFCKAIEVQLIVLRHCNITSFTLSAYNITVLSLGASLFLQECTKPVEISLFRDENFKT